MTSPMRTHHCGTFAERDDGENVAACGWVHNRRDHGGLIFIDLRDHTGFVQIVVEPATKKAFAAAETLRGEHVVRAAGTVRLRPPGTVNPALKTGAVEILAKEIELLNKSRTPAFFPGDLEVTEETRLEHRVIDLRSAGMQRRLRLRHRMAAAVRRSLDERGFIEVETPILTRPTPEGARDFLVPSRMSRGRFYALPQSPQLFKQVLIAGGIDRYYQLARCFRDEDLRSGRQPEFTQIDIELAFAREEDVIESGEAAVRAAWQAAGRDLPDTIPRMTYEEAMSRFATDAPDLRNPIELTDVAQIVRNCSFKVFAGPAKRADGAVVAMNAPGGGVLSRKQIDNLTACARSLGAGGLAYLSVGEPGRGVQGVSSPIAKYLDDFIVNAITAKCGSSAGDIVFFGAGSRDEVAAYMGPVRERAGRELNLIQGGHRPVWIVDFPLFLRDGQTGKLTFSHHPFTAPLPGHENNLLNGDSLEAIVSRAYDLVIDGQEIGGGSIRNHHRETQLAALRAIGIDNTQAAAKFGFLLDTLSQGAPPHGGIALGFDRMVAMACGADSIRDVIAFPKTQSGVCMFTGAPHAADADQLADLGLAPPES